MSRCPRVPECTWPRREQCPGSGGEAVLSECLQGSMPGGGFRTAVPESNCAVILGSGCPTAPLLQAVVILLHGGEGVSICVSPMTSDAEHLCCGRPLRVHSCAGPHLFPSGCSFSVSVSVCPSLLARRLSLILSVSSELEPWRERPLLPMALPFFVLSLPRPPWLLLPAHGCSNTFSAVPTRGFRPLSAAPRRGCCATHGCRPLSLRTRLWLPSSLSATPARGCSRHTHGCRPLSSAPACGFRPLRHARPQLLLRPWLLSPLHCSCPWLPSLLRCSCPWLRPLSAMPVRGCCSCRGCHPSRPRPPVASVLSAAPSRGAAAPAVAAVPSAAPARGFRPSLSAARPPVAAAPCPWLPSPPRAPARGCHPLHCAHGATWSSSRLSLVPLFALVSRSLWGSFLIILP